MRVLLALGHHFGQATEPLQHLNLKSPVFAMAGKARFVGEFVCFVVPAPCETTSLADSVKQLDEKGMVPWASRRGFRRCSQYPFVR